MALKQVCPKRLRMDTGQPPGRTKLTANQHELLSFPEARHPQLNTQARPLLPASEALGTFSILWTWLFGTWVFGTRHPAWRIRFRVPDFFATQFPLCSLIFICSTVPGLAAVSLTDDWNRSIILSSPAVRIVSLAPHLTEMVYFAGGGDRLVAVSENCDYPSTVKSLPQVANHRFINYERISALRPDLALVWGAGLRGAQLAKLEGLAKQVFVSDPADMKSIADTLLKVGTLLGQTQPAQKNAERFMTELETLRQRNAKTEKLKTLYLIWNNPLMAVNADHWISKAIALCNGSNPFSAQSPPVITLSREALYLAHFDVVLHDSRFEEINFGTLREVPIYRFDSRPLNRPSPNIIHGIRSVCTSLQKARAGRP